MSDICPSCGGYTGNGHIVRRLPAVDVSGRPYPIADVPPMKLCDCNKIAGNFIVGDGLPQDIDPGIYWPPIAEPKPTSPVVMLDQQELRKMIEDAVQRALYPGGTISVHEHRRIEMVEESGKRWRGVLHRVDENATDPMVPAVPTGICWACKRPGEPLAMEWHGTHLIHATDECRELANRTMETREHRG